MASVFFDREMIFIQPFCDNFILYIHVMFLLYLSIALVSMSISFLFINLCLIAVLASQLSQSCNFGPLRKKLQNRPLSFASVTVLAPKTNFDSVYADVAP